MNQENKKMVMFDFDGVLVNTIPFAYKAHKDLNQDLTLEHFNSFAEKNFYEGVQKAVENDGHKIPEHWKEKYDANLSTLNINDVLGEVVNTLAEKYILAIVSSSDSRSFAAFLERENLTHSFREICGADMHISKTFKISELLKKYDTENKNAVYITDTLGDIQEARECGVDSIGVLWGQHDRKTLERGKPIAIVDDPRDLISAIENVLK